MVVRESLGERADGTWAARDVGFVLPRQNGKGAVLECIELASLVLFEEETIHSAHLYPTAAEAFLRIRHRVESSYLRKQFKPARLTNGEQALETKNGVRLRFMARSKGGGRGMTADRVVLDEAFELPEALLANILPTLSARPNTQIVYASTSPTEISEATAHLRRLRDRACSDDAGRLCWVEWSAGADDDPDDEDVWYKTNPALGIRILEESVRDERASLSLDSFRTERLGMWPAEVDRGRVIPESWWESCEDTESEIVGRPMFVFDVSPDRGTASISVSGKNGENLDHVELVDRRAGTGWLLPRLVEIHDRWQQDDDLPIIGCDPAGPAGSLVSDLRVAGVQVAEVTARDVGRACGMLYDSVAATHADRAVGGLGKLRHRGQPELAVALAQADRRPIGDAWAWSRKTSAADITSLVSATLALYLARSYIETPPAKVVPSIVMVL